MDNPLPGKIERSTQDRIDFQTSSKLFDDSCQSPERGQAGNQSPVGPAGTNVLSLEKQPGTTATEARAPLSEPDSTEKEPQNSGIIPPYMFEELARRNPDSHQYKDMLNPKHAPQTFWPFPPRPGKDYHGDREVYDAQGKSTHPGKKARFEGEPATGKDEVDKAYNFTGEVRSFYKDLYNRNSIDGKGMKFVSTVNYGDNYNNAFWNGSQMTYGKPGESSPFRTFMLQDICGHEITHGVTEQDAHLQYWGQSGALNESISDIFGELIKQHADHQAAKEGHWLVGEGIWKDSVHGRGLRDILHPGTAYDDPKIGKDPQPDKMKDYVQTTRDHGGVHVNSGIPNRAFALFATSVGGNAWEAPGHIWYAARKAAGSNPSFAQFAYQTIEQAKALGCKDDVEKLQKAWEEVGVKPSASEKDIATPRKPLLTGWTPLYGEETVISRKKDSPAA